MKPDTGHDEDFGPAMKLLTEKQRRLASRNHKKQ
jgi:hypothetical protein